MDSPSSPPIPPCHVVAMPYPGRGHINPMLNLCILLAQRCTDLLITLVVTEEWLGLIGSMDKPPNIRFASIPNVLPSEKVRGDDAHGFAMATLTKLEAPFERLLEDGGLAPPDIIVADALMPWAGEVAGRRNIPMAQLWTMSASVYTVFYHFDLLVQNGHFPLDLAVNGHEIVDYIPGLSPVRLADLPSILRKPKSMRILLKIMPNQTSANFIIFTSIYELEKQVIEALIQTSPLSIFNIGPAISYSNLAAAAGDDDKASYLKWLDLQPRNSVLYVSLGSFLHIPMAQMEEIAAGLSLSGVRFLWVARREAARLQSMSGEKGMVVEWCEQLRVLSHPSVGGFFTHCGWNSTKEAVMAGVPMLTFPILMDQLLDAKVVVEDWRIGWRVLEGAFDEREVKRRDEIGEIVRRFMDLESVEREEMSRNVREMQKACEREFGSGGAFQINFDGFVQSLLSCCSLKSRKGI